MTSNAQVLKTEKALILLNTKYKKDQTKIIMMANIEIMAKKVLLIDTVFSKILLEEVQYPSQSNYKRC